MVFVAAYMMAIVMAQFVEFILGMCGHQWIPFPHLNFFSLLLEEYFTIVFASATSPFADPTKGLTGFFEGSCGFSDVISLSKDDIMALFDGCSPVLAVSAVMLCIVLLVRPPSCGGCGHRRG